MDAIQKLAGVAAIVLIVEMLAVAILAGIVVYFARRGLIVGRERLEQWLGIAREYVEQAEEVTTKTSQTIVSTQIGLISEVRALRRAIETFLEE